MHPRPGVAARDSGVSQGAESRTGMHVPIACWDLAGSWLMARMFVERPSMAQAMLRAAFLNAHFRSEPSERAAPASRTPLARAPSTGDGECFSQPPREQPYPGAMCTPV